MKNKHCKYIFVTGGVLSGVGKGITTASMGAILKDKGMRVSVQKCDPYLNVDAGQLNPLEHGECFVTKDGAETDLDLGHYERFLDVELTRKATTLSGSIFWELLEKERAGKFGGKTVQMVPHFTNLVQERIMAASEGSEVHIVEIGGTVGDYESLAFVEAIRLFANRVGRENCLYVSVVYVPWINTSKELKTKPAQNALRDLRGFGIVPDVVCVRTEEKAPNEICEKIANFSGVAKEAVVNLPDIDSVYDVPLNILKSGVLSILNEFTGNEVAPKMRKWRDFSRKRREVERGDGLEKMGKENDLGSSEVLGGLGSASNPEDLGEEGIDLTKLRNVLKVGLVTKYLGNEDVGLSIMEAVKAAGVWQGVRVEFEWVGCDERGVVRDGAVSEKEGEDEENETVVTQRTGEYLTKFGFDGIVEIEGFGRFCRGGAAEWAILKGVPYLGLGRDEGEKWLGEKEIELEKGCGVAKMYKSEVIWERERYKYRMTEEEVGRMEELGVRVVGKAGRVPVVLEGEGWMVMMQGRPEYKARPLLGHGLFGGFVKAMK